MITAPLPYFISFVCLSVNPIYDTACTNALTATSMEFHIKQDMDFYQDKLQKKVETEVTNITGKDIWVVVGVGYQLYEKQSLIFAIPAKPVADSLSANLNATSQNLGLSWAF